MPDVLPKQVQHLIRVFSRLPGVGTRTAMRFALHLVREGSGPLKELAEALADTAANVTLCKSCYSMADAGGVCDVCQDAGRTAEALCVVESIGDLLAIEATGQYHGRYFVLHRLLSPLKGIGPEELHISHLIERIRAEHISELVLATPLTTDGETTATYIGRLAAPVGLRITRLASGVPVGGTIEYLDRLTLARAFQDRKKF